jgi:hypothetical protein
VIGMKRSLNVQIPEIEEIIATACAIENIYLSICAYHLSGYFSTGGITYLPEAKSYFNLDTTDKLIGVFYLGFVENVPNPLSKREPVKEKTRWINQ